MEKRTPNVEDGDKTVKLVNVGATLRDAREKAGMSVADIADRIKFAPRQVEALEENDFVNLPQAPFLRGFVRSYARVLQLDERSLIASLPSAPSHIEPAGENKADVPFPNPLSMSSVNRLWLWGALGVGVLLVLFLLLPASQKGQVEPVVETVKLPDAETPASSPVAVAQPAEIQVKQESVAEAKPAVIEKPVVVEKPVIAEKKPAETVVKAPLPVAVAASSAASALSLEMLRRRPMHFVFTGDTWVEVVDIHGELLLSRTSVAGTEKWIGGPNRAPYSVTINHPERVKLFYKGKQIDLSAYTGAEAAHFKVE